MAKKTKKLSAAELKSLLDAIAAGREVSPEFREFVPGISPEQQARAEAMRAESEAAFLKAEEARRAALELELRPPIMAAMELKERQAESARLPSFLIPDDPKEAEKIQADLRRRQIEMKPSRRAETETGEVRVPLFREQRRIEEVTLPTTGGTRLQRRGALIVSAGRSKRAAFSDAAQKRIIRQVKQFLEERPSLDPESARQGGTLLTDLKASLSKAEQPFLDEILADPARLLARIGVERLPGGGKRIAEPKNEGERKIKAVYEKLQEALTKAESVPRVTARRSGPKKGRVEYSREGGSIALTPMTNEKGETVFALPDLSPIAFSQMYARNPPKRDSFQPTPRDPAVQARVVDWERKNPEPTDPKDRVKWLNGRALAARKAIEEVGDLQWKISRAQWDATRDLIKQSPVLIEVETPEDRAFIAENPVPLRAEFEPGAKGYEEFRGKFNAWLQKSQAYKGGGTDFYICPKCDDSVKTGHSCACRLEQRLKFPKMFNPPEEPKRLTELLQQKDRGPLSEAQTAELGRLSADYAKRYDKARETYLAGRFKPFQIPEPKESEYERDDMGRVKMDPQTGEPQMKVAYLVRLRSAKERYERAREEFLNRERSRFMQQLARMPAEKRLYEEIARQISKKLGKRPTDPEAAREYDAKKMALAGEELQVRIAEMLSATEEPAYQRGYGFEKILVKKPVYDRYGKWLRDEVEIQYKPTTQQAIIPASWNWGRKKKTPPVMPGDVVVSADSQSEAEAKATEAMARVVAPGLMRRQKPSQEVRTPVLPAAPEAAQAPRPDEGRQAATRAARLRALEKLEKKGALSPAQVSELKRLREGGLSGLGIAWSEDIGGTATTVAVGGLVVYALFKALTSKR